MLRLASGIVLLLFCRLPALAGSPCTVSFPPGSPDRQNIPSVTVEVEQVSLAGVTRDGLQFAVAVALTAAGDARVRQVAFENLRLNDLPFYTAPITEPLSLAAGRRLRLPQALQLQVFYRDLDSVRPLQRMVEEGRLQIEGTVYFDVELGRLAKLLLWTRRARVPAGFRQEMPLQLPGGKPARAAALGILEGAAKTLDHVQPGLETLLARASRWRKQLWQDYAPALLLVGTRFALRDQQRLQVLFACTGTGLRISPQEFLVSKETIEPWRFDPEMAALEKDGLRLDLGSYDVWVRPSQEPSSAAVHLRRGQIGVVRRPGDENETFWLPRRKGRPVQLQVHKRDSPANLALLRFLEPAGQTTPRMQYGDSSSAWDRLAVFRIPRGNSAPPARPNLVFVSAKREGTRIRLATPLDPGAWGAPLISPQGIVGIVLNERTGLALEEAFRVLKLSPEK